ncbi:hypothetical protein EAG_11805, partial [Camponotus floridanus]
FFIMSFLKNKVYQILQENDVEILKNRLRNACAEATSFMIKQERDIFMDRIAFCLEKNSDYI